MKRSSVLRNLRLVVKTALLPRTEQGISIARFGLLTTMMLGLTGLLVVCGWAIAAGDVELMFVPVAAAGVCSLAFYQRGAFIGILVLVAMNGVPFVATSRELISGKLTVEDVAAIILLLTAGVWILFDDRSYHPSRTARVISSFAVLLIAWWLLTVVRTVVGQGIPIFSAGSFGKDFAFFAFLLILLPRIRLTNRDIGTLLGVLSAGVCLFAVGQIMIATGIGDPGNLIHFQYTLQESGFTGLTRVYSNMTDLVTAGLAASFAAIMLSRNRTVRLVALPMVVLLTTSTIVQLTRARWVGLVVGIVVVTCWLTIINGQTSVATLLRKRLALVVGILGLATILILTTAPDILSGGTTIHRFSSLFTDLQTGGGTVAVREAATKTMKAYLGGGWLSGLGFIPPSRHYFESLPHGSIRDADLGVLNAVMTMGVIGAVLIYLPVIWMLTDCLRRRSLQQAAEYDWLRYGGAIWIVATLVSSITLVTLFSTSGLVLVSVGVMILVHPSVSGLLAPPKAAYARPERKPSLWQPRADLPTVSS